MTNTLGLRIKQLRECDNLTQLELARELNVSNTTLSQYESGQRIPSDDIKIKIARYFGVSVDYLLGQDEPLKSICKEKELSPALQALLTSVLDLTEEQIKQTAEYIDFLNYKNRKNSN